MTQGDAARKAKRQPTHDSGYKRLFAHAAMVRDLLRGFVPGAKVQALKPPAVGRRPDRR